MSNEMERAFAALTDDAGRVPLAPARSLRKRGDRRTVVQAVAGAAAVAVLITGVSIGARTLLAGPPRPAPVPADSEPPSPVVSPSVSTSPSSPTPGSSSSPTARSIPSTIPLRAFLHAGDVPGRIKEVPQRRDTDAHELPRFCRATYDRDGQVGVRGTVWLTYGGPKDSTESTPKAAVYEDVIVYRGDGASAFMDELRGAVNGCPSQKDPSGVTLRNYARGGVGAGDESLLIERTRPATGDDGTPTGDGSLHHLFWAAVRVGDAVAFVSNTGWESGSAERADTVELGKRAAARLAAWRG